MTMCEVQLAYANDPAEPLAPLLEVKCQYEGGEDSTEHEEGKPGLEERCPAEGHRKGSVC